MRDWIWAVGIAAGWIVALLIFASVSGCKPYSLERTYTDGASQWNLSVMLQCGAAIAKAPFVLTDDEKNLHYQRCIVRNGATI